MIPKSKIKMLFAFTLAFLCVQPGNVAAQKTTELDTISEKIQSAISQAMPEWKCRRGEPITGKNSVVIMSCRFCEAGVVVSVIRLASVDEAAKRFHDGGRFERDRENVSGIGEEAYAHGFRKASFVFRRQNLIVSVSISAEDMQDMEKISKRFAEIVSDALKD